jgi:hypothetical protein
MPLEDEKFSRFVDVIWRIYVNILMLDAMQVPIYESYLKDISTRSDHYLRWIGSCLQKDAVLLSLMVSLISWVTKAFEPSLV